MQQALESSSSDDDDELIIATAHIAHNQYKLLNAPRHGGSVPGRQEVHRNREAGHSRLHNDYFSDAPTYGPTVFRRRFTIRSYVLFTFVDDLLFINQFSFPRRFRMSRSLFLRIVNVVEAHDGYFVQKRNAAGHLGLSSIQKITAAFRMIAYGVPADATDDYLRIGESTVIESLRRFVKAIVEVFGDEYLRQPNENDTARLLAIGEANGFSGMLGSIDCMH